MHHALLLAGGKSSRMGQDKSRLEIEGRTLLDRSLDLLRQTGAGRVLISGDVSGYDCIPDLLPDCGPLGGLHAVMHTLDMEDALDGSPLLVIPVDMPQLDSKTLTRLLDSLDKSEACHYENEIFPCVFRLSEKLKAHLDYLFAEDKTLGGKRSMRALLSLFSEKPLSTTTLPKQVFKNLNYSEEWEQFRK